MDKPTEEQIKEFWEWCGIEKPPCDRIGGCLHDMGMGSCKCDEWEYPPIDLNNLFKYAVPKLGDWVCVKFDIEYGDIWAYVSDKNGKDAFSPKCKDPALALFWAIWQVKSPKAKPPFSVGYVDE